MKVITGCSRGARGLQREGRQRSRRRVSFSLEKKKKEPPAAGRICGGLKEEENPQKKKLEELLLKLFSLCALPPPAAGPRLYCACPLPVYNTPIVSRGPAVTSSES